MGGSFPHFFINTVGEAKRDEKREKEKEEKMENEKEKSVGTKKREGIQLIRGKKKEESQKE